MRRLIIISIIYLLGYSAYDQVDINRIKNDKSYYTGEGEGVTKEEAHQNGNGMGKGREKGFLFHAFFFLSSYSLLSRE